MQLGLTVMSIRFPPGAKGRNYRNLLLTASGLASFTIPVFTAWISRLVFMKLCGLTY